MTDVAISLTFGCISGSSCQVLTDLLVNLTQKPIQLCFHETTVFIQYNGSKSVIFK